MRKAPPERGFLLREISVWMCVKRRKHWARQEAYVGFCRCAGWVSDFLSCTKGKDFFDVFSASIGRKTYYKHDDDSNVGQSKPNKRKNDSEKILGLY